jgi:cytochrome c oxidase subunit III
VIGAANTAVLLCSSFTMVLAVRAAQMGSRKALIMFPDPDPVLGGVFLGVKAYEWNEKFVEHHIPGPTSIWKARRSRARRSCSSRFISP